MIPIELMKDKKLDWTNKALLTEIHSLHKLPNGCIASNEHFAELLGIKSPAASKRISKLKKLGYISTEDVYNKQLCVGRIITPIEKVSETELPKQKKEKQKESNKLPEMESADTLPEMEEIDGQNSEHDQAQGTSHKNHTPLPEEPGGTTQTIIGVLPEEPGGTSHGNTINTSISSDIKSHILIQYTGETQIEQFNIETLSNQEELPEEFKKVKVKIDNYGWKSLSVPEAAIYWKYHRK